MFNKDYYPTPENLIYKMLNKVDMRTISSVLEPSAGKGNLAKAVNNKLKNISYRSDKTMYDIDCIEIEPQLQHILRGEGYRVIHDDFLTFNTMKSYSLIIANFPFSEGDKHLLKCIDIQKNGGQIVCLINAETLKNPYSNIRQDLVRKLEELNADIEYIQDAFTTAERKTGVEIALISISISCNTSNSLIVEKLKQEERIATEHVTEANEVIHGDFIQGIVQQYNYEVKASVNLIEEYYKLQPLMIRSFNGDNEPILKLEINNINIKSHTREELINNCIKDIRTKYWTTLFQSNKFSDLFTNKLRVEFQEKMTELRDYDFSEYNISEIKLQINKGMKKSIEETILELFEEFSNKHSCDNFSKNIHYFNGWKTNSCYKINKKVVILLKGFSENRGNYTIDYGYNVKNKLEDIEKVFNYLDAGISEDFTDLREILKTAQQYEETKEIDFRHFSVTFFKKGTAHLTFTNDSLLQKFNIFGCQRKNWLPPNYAKKMYKDMTKEDKAIIDSFEGKESYEKVVANPDYFIFNTSKLLQITA